MQRQLDPYTFSPIQWDWDDEDEYQEFLIEQAQERYEFLEGVAHDLERMGDDARVEYLSDLDLSPEDYEALDVIRRQTTEIHA